MPKHAERANELEKIQWEKENKQIETKNIIETKLKEEILLDLSKVQKEMAFGRIAHFKKRSLDTLYEVNNKAKREEGSMGEVQVNGGAISESTPVYETHENVSRFEIELDPENTFIKDKDLEEKLWRGDFEGVSSKLVFHGDEKEHQKKLSLQKGVNKFGDSVWAYDDHGKISLTMRGKHSVYDYHVVGNSLKLTNNKESLEFESVSI